MTKICVIGAGNWGKNHVKTLFKLGLLEGIIDANTSRRLDLQNDYPSVQIFGSLEEPGALNFSAYTVAVPAEFHYDITLKLLQNDKHVLVEKPLTLDVNTSSTLVNLAKKKKLVLMTGHLLLFHPAIRKIKALINENKIGKLQYIYSNRLNLGTVRKEENSLWNFAPHDISVLNYLTDAFPHKVDSNGGAFLQPHIHDTTMTNLAYPNNIVAHIFVSWLHPFKEHRLVIIGSKGMLSYEDSSADKILKFYEKGIDWINGEPIKRDGPTETIPYEKGAPLALELQHFHNCICEKEANTLISGEHGLDVLKVLESANQSLTQAPKQQQNSTIEASSDYKVHPSATIDPSANIAKGSKIWNFSNIQKNAQIGANCILGQNVNIGPNVKIGHSCKIQNNVSVYEGVELEDYVFCGPSMVFTNINIPRSKYPQAGAEFYQRTLIKEGASIGANATIVCGVTLGRHCLIGAGAVVTKDVPDFAIIVGNPGKQIGWLSEGGTPLTFTEDPSQFCPKSNQTYQLEEGIVVEVKKEGVLT